MIRMLCGVLSFTLTIAMAQCEDPVHPYLKRPLFTVFVRSGDLLEKLMKDPDVPGYRFALFGDGLLKSIAEDSKNGRLPLENSYSRTWLACPKFGWDQGGHTIDVLTAQEADYKSLLRKSGLAIQQIKNTPLWTYNRGEAFILPLDDTVASLKMPTGGEFQNRHLEKCLLSQIAAHRTISTSENPGLFLSVKPRNLLPEDVARSITTGLSVKRQRIDGESDATYQFRAGRIIAIQDWMKLALEDIEIVSLAADLLESDEFSMTLKLHPTPRSELASRIAELSTHRMISQISWPESLSPNAVAAVCVPRILSQTLLGSETEGEEHTIESMVAFQFGSESARSYWMGFDPGWNPDAGWPGTDFLKEPDTTLLRNNSVLEFTRSPLIFLTARSDADANTQRLDLSNLGAARLRKEHVPAGCIFYAMLYPKQFLPSILSPDSTKRIQYNTATDRVVLVGLIDNGDLTLRITFPPDSGELVYATMETALVLLRKVAEFSNLPEE